MVSGLPFLPLILLTHLEVLLAWDCFLEEEPAGYFVLREAGSDDTGLTPLWLS